MSYYSAFSTNYRKIYVENFGPIPKDNDGVSYDIHHKDGNRKNNDPANLLALSRQQHYELHLEQGDYYAALRIAQRLGLGATTQSQIARQANLDRVRRGVHQFLGGKVHRMLLAEGRFPASGPEMNRRRVENGNHPWLGGEVSRQVTKRRLADGTHNFLTMTTEERRERQMRLVRKGSHHFCGDTNPVYKQLATGTHNFFGGEIQRRHNRRRVADGSHHLLSGDIQRQALENGTHPSCIKVDCPHCGKTGSLGPMKAHHFDYCKKNPNRQIRPVTECPHCNKIGTKHELSISHFEKCKENPGRVEKPKKSAQKIKCSHCHTVVDVMNSGRWHGDKCKKRPPLQCT